MTDDETREAIRWRIEHDRLSRDQFRPLTETGYVCEHDGIPATYVRDAIPSKRAKYPVHLCAVCFLTLPATQQDA